MDDPILQASVVLLLAGAAGAVLPLLRGWSDTGLHGLVAIAAGVLLGTLFLHLLPELTAAHPAGDGDWLLRRGPWCAALVGLLLLFFLERIVLASEEDPHAVVGMATFIGLSIHALVEGVGLASLLTGRPTLAWTILLPIAIHKAGDGFSLAAVLRLARRPRRGTAALLVLFLLTSPLGLVLGARLLGPAATTSGALLTGLAAGTFLYVAVCDLLPEVFHASGRRSLRVAGLLVGLAVSALGVLRLS